MGHRVVPIRARSGNPMGARSVLRSKSEDFCTGSEKFGFSYKRFFFKTIIL